MNNPDLDKLPIAEQSDLVEQVPVIDIADLLIDSTSPAARTAVDQIANACRTWGFFQVVNHGIESSMIEQVWRETRAIFALPVELKLSALRDRDNPWGYYNNELTKNQRDKKEIYDITEAGIDPIYHQSNRWISGQDDFRSTMLDYFDACTGLSLSLLEAFCVGLDLPPKFMHQHFEPGHTGFLRLNYYPVEDPMSGLDADYQPVADLGVHHHTDAGALTVLLQDDIGGLQVHKDGFWHNIPPVSGAMVINTGDMMQVWSNDIYHAPVHRVLAMEQHDRYSLPFFFNPAAGTQVVPLPTVVNETRPKRYHTVDWSAFRGKRTDGDYADYGMEVQISQFRC